MSTAEARLYDEVPYESGPYAETHPDSLATVATLFGMTPPGIRACRVLELGCARGSNVIPMALGLPEGRFVGLDFSPRQIADGQRTIDALGLRNIDLRVMNLLDVDRQLGEFDYIVCHGVFSWVPRLVQDKILAICSAHLRPDGVAYVSYNTYPGWHGRRMVREMVLDHVDAAAPPRERVRQAREFLEVLGQSCSRPTSPFAESIKSEWRLWQKLPDECILHDPLGDVNEPVYFHEFVGRAAEHRLQFIAEAELWDSAGAPPEKVRQSPLCCPGDLVRREQHLDFLRGRTFRRSLLCHEGARLNREPQPELIERFLLEGRAIPVESRGSDAPSVLQFRTDEGVTLSTSKPWVKAALLTLFDRWPRLIAFDELYLQARRHLHSPRDLELDPLQDPTVLKEPLLRCALIGLVGLHLHPRSEVAEVSERPRASPLARLQAKEGANVTTLRHRRLALNEFDRQVLLRLDGRQTHAELLQALSASADSGEISFAGLPGDGAEPSPEVLSRLLAKTLRRLARSGLLAG
ncbi:MAG TPA: class I SAM-dependent methyltransferase [Pirellulales bacterium]|nr:class I SAM-dependent methyltransferase [Pirellulales bacterium]